MQDNTEGYRDAGFLSSFEVLVPTTQPPVVASGDLSPGAIVGIIIAAVVAAVVLVVVVILVIYAM